MGSSVTFANLGTAWCCRWRTFGLPSFRGGAEMFEAYIALQCILVSASAHQLPGDGTIEAAIKKLSSQNYRDRHAATQWLMGHPESANALLRASKSDDQEVASRAAAILKHFERLPATDLRTAARSGEVARFIEVATNLPEGKFDADAWESVSDLANTIVKLHKNRGGQEISWLTYREPPEFLFAKRFDGPAQESDRMRFLRSGDVRWHDRDAGSQVILSTGSVRMLSSQATGVIFARGSVEIENVANRLVLVSCDDVVLKGRAVECLVIARGRVTALSGIYGGRVVSGKCVVCDGMRGGAISENDSNPLGFIRWADAPKEKEAGKTPAKSGEKKQ